MMGARVTPALLSPPKAVRPGAARAGRICTSCSWAYRPPRRSSSSCDALFDDRAVVHRENQIGVPHGREAVRDHERRPAEHEPVERIEDDRFGPRIDRCGRLVENQDAGVLQERPCDAEALALAARQANAALADLRLVSFGKPRDEFMGVGGGRGRDDVVHRRLEAAVADVVCDRAREEQRLLRDDADVIAQRLQREPADVAAVEKHAAEQRIVEARNQARQRCLARARGADDRDHLAWRRIEGDVLQRVRPARIAERHVVERDAARGLVRASPARRPHG